MYVLRTGCQWKALPKSEFGSSSSVHQYFLDWEAAGLFEQLWQISLREYDEMEGIAWEWQSLDEAMVKAPLALESVGRNPTDRGKKGSKRSFLTDQKGVPLSIVLSGANKHDVKLLAATLDALVIERPEVEESRQHIFAWMRAMSVNRQDKRCWIETMYPIFAPEVKRSKKKPGTPILSRNVGW